MKIERDPVNALTVDVEDYYQVEAFADVVPRGEWDRWESRVEANVLRLLELFARQGVSARKSKAIARPPIRLPGKRFGRSIFWSKKASAMTLRFFRFITTAMACRARNGFPT